jgi:uncharacterized protein HemY
MAELPISEAIMKQILALNDKYGNGAVQEFFIAYEAARAPAAGGSFARAGEYFEKALLYSQGKKASPYVVYAESVAVRQQDLPRFRKLLDQALAVDVNKEPDLRLANTIAQEKARWLLKRVPDLFLTDDEEQNGKEK